MEPLSAFRSSSTQRAQDVIDDRDSVARVRADRGTGPYMLAEFYGREAHVTSRTILLSTLGSIVSLSVLLAIAPQV
ncbi:hypothetical protein BCC0191_004936 [Burkholderia ambifaria]|jgi:predicted permease